MCSICYLRQGSWVSNLVVLLLLLMCRSLMKEDLFEDLQRYRRLVGKLNYLTVTRLDIAYSVSVLSQYMSSSTVSHWAAVEHILCYLKEAPERVILYKMHGYTIIECFSDAD